jgi:hypothetical protein
MSDQVEVKRAEIGKLAGELAPAQHVRSGVRSTGVVDARAGCLWVTVWSVTSAKPGNGVEMLRDDNLDTFWQCVHPLICPNPKESESGVTPRVSHEAVRFALGVMTVARVRLVSDRTTYVQWSDGPHMRCWRAETGHEADMAGLTVPSRTS